MNTKLLGWNGYVYDFLFILTDKLQSNNGLNKQNSRGNDRPRPQIRFTIALVSGDVVCLKSYYLRISTGI